jgi:hypothetical protein
LNLFVTGGTQGKKYSSSIPEEQITSEREAVVVYFQARTWQSFKDIQVISHVLFNWEVMHLPRSPKRAGSNFDGVTGYSG